MTADAEAELERLRRRNAKLSALLEVAKALTAELSFDNLLDMILHASVKTVDAERGTLFIVDRAKRELWSKIAHGLETRTIRLAMGQGIAGLVAETRRPLNIAKAYEDTRFNREVDQATGFRTESILCVPMLGKQDVVGVVQVLNHGPSGPFTAEDEELLMALGANAAAAIENANLYEEIERLLEGFVQASVTAIEQRDPTTSGHSGRVASLSVALLESLPHSGGPYHNLRFTDRDLRELRYAALLHDFGKVGVREHILVKAAKLFPHELDLLMARFEHARQALELRRVRARLESLERHGLERGIDLAKKTDDEYQRKIDELEGTMRFIHQCNRPAVLETGGFERLREIAELAYVDARGFERPLLTEREVKNLAIPRGSLNEEERRQIEGHVVHTWNFLRQIPWTRDLARVPEFAHGHHEKLDGTGYPRGIRAEAIPIQTRVMTVADIYDALTASDRPYKTAMPHERALSILEGDAVRGKIDRAVLDVFIEAEVAFRVLGRRPGGATGAQPPARPA